MRLGRPVAPIVLTTEERARDLPHRPVFVRGAAGGFLGDADYGRMSVGAGAGASGSSSGGKVLTARALAASVSGHMPSGHLSSPPTVARCAASASR